MDAGTRADAPLTSIDLSELRAAARPSGLRLALTGRGEAKRLERLDRLNHRRLLTFRGLRRRENGACEVIYAVSESGRAACRLH